MPLNQKPDYMQQRDVPAEVADLRDRFAMFALTGLLVAGNTTKDASQLAYIAADFMLLERSKPNKGV